MRLLVSLPTAPREWCARFVAFLLQTTPNHIQHTKQPKNEVLNASGLLIVLIPLFFLTMGFEPARMERVVGVQFAVMLLFLGVAGWEEGQPYARRWGAPTERVAQMLSDTTSVGYERLDTKLLNSNEPLERLDPNSTRTQGITEYYTRVGIKGNSERNHLNGLLYYVREPSETFSVLPPREGCGHAYTPQESSEGRCLIATNAGFFNTTDHTCHGTLISDGEVENEGDEMNASFGILEDDSIVVGYITEAEKRSLKFKQLVNGVGWLVRNGTKYVDQSRDFEDWDTQESGTDFRTLVTGRLAVGHDKEGRVMIMAIDGFPGFAPKPWGSWRSAGATMDDMAAMMIDAGAVNAINLDGGGSVSVFENDVLVSSPTDKCSKEGQGIVMQSLVPRCARSVTSILCVHAPPIPVETSSPPTVAPSRTKNETEDLIELCDLLGGPHQTTPLYRQLFVTFLVLFITLLTLLIAVFLWRCTCIGPCIRGDISGDAHNANREGSGNGLPSRVPPYSSNPLHAVKKLRKKRGSRTVVAPRTEIDLELVNLPATGYESDSSATATATATPRPAPTTPLSHNL